MDCENKKTFLEKSKSIVHEQTSSIRKYIEEQKKAIQLEKQQIQEMENALSRDLLLELTEYGENRKRIFEIISKFPCLEQNVWYFTYKRKVQRVLTNSIHFLQVCKPVLGVLLLHEP